MKSLIVTEYRCRCGRLLFKGLLLKDLVEAKCAHCNSVSLFKGLNVPDSPDRFVILATPGGTIVNVSASAETLLGFSMEKLVGGKIEKLFAGEIEKEADQAIAKKIIGKKYLRLGNTYKKSDGGALPVFVCYKHIQKGDREFILRIVDIIPEADENAIKQANFSSENIGDFVAEMDENSMVLYIDPSIEKIFGYRPEEVIGRSLAEFRVPEDNEWREKNTKMLVSQKKSFRAPDFRTLAKDGKIMDYEAYGTPFYDDVGDFLGYRFVCWMKDENFSK